MQIRMAGLPEPLGTQGTPSGKQAHQSKRWHNSILLATSHRCEATHWNESDRDR